MRNNEERLGSQKQTEVSLETQLVNNQTLNLSFITPTEFVDLPSRGLFYKEGHPLSGKSSIEIKQMTAKEEDILTNKSLIKKGVALEKLLESVILDKKIDPGSLLICDRNAIFVASRISAYGNNYATQIVCPSCEKKTKYEFDLFEKLDLSEKPEIVVNESKSFSITLPSTKWVVECRPLNGSDERKLLGTLTTKTKEEFTLVDQLNMLIVSIQGQTDRAIIAKAIEQMPAADSKYLRREYNNIVPSLDIKGTFICDSCEYEEVLEVPLTAEFFWPK